MATIRKRTLKSGADSFTAQIVRRTSAYQENRTFDKQKAAEVWAKAREIEIDADIAVGQTPKKRSEKNVTLGEIIDRYIATQRAAIGDTKAQVLRTIRTEHDIADLPCNRIKSPDIVTLAGEIWARVNVKSGATISNYIEHLSAVFSVADTMLGAPLDEGARPAKH